MIPVTGVCSLDQMRGGDEEDHRLLLIMADQAKAFLKSFHWCAGIKAEYFGDGYGGIVAVFCFQIEPALSGIDEWLWVLVGDFPPAYMGIHSASKPSEVLQRYIEGATRWIESVRTGSSEYRELSIRLPADLQNAQQLEIRLRVFSQHFVSAFQQSELLAS